MGKELRNEQHYAVSKDGLLTYIREAHNSSEDFFCPYCQCRMIKKCGKKRVWHFAHDYRYDNESQKKCSYESYLHSFAKLRLKQWFDESESMPIQYKQTTFCEKIDTCKLAERIQCNQISTITHDLKKWFDNCEVEVSARECNGTYRADLLLTSSKLQEERLYIEINVTHGCTKKKIESGARIIEFDITSEEDVEYIVSHGIEESEKVRIYGFKDSEKTDETGIVKPRISMQKFVQFGESKVDIINCNCQTYEKRTIASMLEITVYAYDGADYRLSNYLELMNFGKYMKSIIYDFQYPKCSLCVSCCYNKKIGHYECVIKKRYFRYGG